MCLAPNLFGIVFRVLSSYAFMGAPGTVHIRTRLNDLHFSQAYLRVKINITKELLRELLLVDDAALVANCEASLQTLINNLSKTCDTFCLTVSATKSVVLD